MVKNNPLSTEGRERVVQHSADRVSPRLCQVITRAVDSPRHRFARRPSLCLWHKEGFSANYLSNLLPPQSLYHQWTDW